VQRRTEVQVPFVNSHRCAIRGASVIQTVKPLNNVRTPVACRISKGNNPSSLLVHGTELHINVTTSLDGEMPGIPGAVSNNKCFKPTGEGKSPIVGISIG